MKNSNRKYIFIVLSLMMSVMVGQNAHGVQERTAEAGKVPCAVLENFDGEVQLLDATRMNLLSTTMKAGIACGGWITVRKGWAELKHRQGPTLKLGPGTFVEIFDNEGDKYMTGSDHVVLYRGKVYLKASKGSGEFRIVTANARMRVEGGAFLISYSQSEEETQLVALEDAGALENRFEPARSIKVKAGEATSLNFKALRVIPTTPGAVNFASLKTKLDDLPLSGVEYENVMRTALNRKSRGFASNLDKDNKSRTGVLPGGRQLASQSGKNNSVYVVHQPQVSDADAMQAWVRRLVGGELAGEKILFPEKISGAKRQPAQVVVDDPGVVFDQQDKKKYEAEKKHLIEELSRIRPD